MQEYNFVTTSQAAELLNVSVRVIRRAIQSKKLPAYKMAREYSISRKDLDEWVRNTRTVKETKDE